MTTESVNADPDSLSGFDSASLNELAAIVTERNGFTPLNIRYGIARDILTAGYAKQGVTS